jgi:hypothetical protein
LLALLVVVAAWTGSAAVGSGLLLSVGSSVSTAAIPHDEAPESASVPTSEGRTVRAAPLRSSTRAGRVPLASAFARALHARLGRWTRRALPAWRGPPVLLI